MPSGPTPSGNLALPPIEELVYRGLAQRLREVFEAPVVVHNGDDEVQVLAQARQGQVTYPYLFIKDTAYNVNHAGYRTKPLARDGIVLQVPSDDLIQTYRIPVLPVEISLEANYKDNDYRRVRRFGKRWLFASQEGHLKFTVIYGGVSFSIAVNLDESFTLPVRSSDPSQIQEYTGTGLLTMQGYLSPELAIAQPIVKELDLDLYLKTQAPTNAQSHVATFRFPAGKKPILSEP